MATSSKKSTVIWEKRYFPVTATTFEHENGDSRPSYSVKLSCSFRRNEESEWESTDYLSPQNLLPASKLLEEAYSFIQAKLQKAYEQRREAVAATTSEEVPY